MAPNEIQLPFQLWPKQVMALQSPAREILYGGSTRGGKSHLGRVALCVWSINIPKLQSKLIRKKRQDILDNHVYGPNGFQDLLRPLIERKLCSVTQDNVSFWNGSRIVYVHCQDERQLDSAQGVGTHVLFIDEAPQISERLLRMFRAWCTMTVEMQKELPEEFRGMFPRIMYGANPMGPSMSYFRRHFVKARAPYSFELVDGFTRQYIPALVADNPSEDPEATKGRVYGLHDAATAKALLEADWDAPLGDFYPEWDEARHVIPDFQPPTHWFRYRSFDWGSADPFAVYWVAIADGEDFETEYWTYAQGAPKRVAGRLWFPRGAKIFYREWYGCRADDPAKGIGMRNADIARGIVQRSPASEERGVITLTDSYVFPDRGEEGGQTIAKTFKDNGVELTLGDTSRVTGWAAMRDALIGVRYDLNSEHRDPMMFVCESCKYLRDYIPALPRHPNEAKRHEDAAESGEATHACDAARLAIMATPKVKDKPQPNPERVKAHIAKGTAYQPTMGDAIKLLKQQKARGNGKQF